MGWQGCSWWASSVRGGEGRSKVEEERGQGGVGKGGGRGGAGASAMGEGESAATTVGSLAAQLDLPLLLDLANRRPNKDI